MTNKNYSPAETQDSLFFTPNSGWLSNGGFFRSLSFPKARWSSPFFISVPCPLGSLCQKNRYFMRSFYLTRAWVISLWIQVRLAHSVISPFVLCIPWLSLWYRIFITCPHPLSPIIRILRSLSTFFVLPPMLQAHLFFFPFIWYLPFLDNFSIISSNSPHSLLGSIFILRNSFPFWSIAEFIVFLKTELILIVCFQPK